MPDDLFNKIPSEGAGQATVIGGIVVAAFAAIYKIVDAFIKLLGRRNGKPPEAEPDLTRDTNAARQLELLRRLQEDVDYLREREKRAERRLTEIAEDLDRLRRDGGYKVAPLGRNDQPG